MNNQKPLDWTKPLTFRNAPHLKVVQVLPDLENPNDPSYPKSVLVYSLTDRRYYVCTYTTDGRSVLHKDLDTDLLNAPVEIKIDGWVNVWMDGDGEINLDMDEISPYATKEAADKYRARARNTKWLACVHVSRLGCFNEGEGL